MNQTSLISESQIAGTHDDASRWHWLRTTLVLICVVTVIRAVLNFRHELAPGMDAAYYPMQTRWLIENGELFWDAPPLTFWIIAGFTMMSHSLFGMSIDDGCLFYSRLIDVIIPPWVALPIMMLGYRWANGRREAIIGCVAAALLATMSPPIMRMASDFQKNSIGLVWMAFAMWAVNEALVRKNNVLAWTCVGLIMLLAAITHIGAFGVTCVMVGSTVIGHLLLSKSKRVWLKTAVIVGSIIASAAFMLIVLSAVTPDSRDLLLDLPARAMGMLETRVSPVSIVMALVIYVASYSALRRIWATRHRVDAADSAIRVGCIAGLMVLFFPMLEGSWTMRFQLMTPIPGAILLAFWISRLTVTKSATWQPKRFAIIAAILAVVSPFAMQGPVITTAIAEEMKLFGQQLERPEKTLVVAPHGVEFWAGVMMHTQATQSVVPQKLSGYHRVLVLVPKGNFGRLGPPQPGGQGPGGPPDRHHPGHPPRPENDVAVPDDARLFYNGEHFRVLEVRKDHLAT